MNWTGKMTKFKKFMLFFLIAIIGLNSYVVAEEKQKSEQWEIELVKLIKEKRYDEAFTVTNQDNIEESTSLYYNRGLLLGSGVLSTGQNICAAILNLEKAYKEWKFVQGALNFLYGGDWASVAAMEGNSDALYFSGLRALTSNRSDNPFLSLDESLPIKTAYRFFYNAAELGHQKAKKKLAALEAEYLNIDFSKYQTKMDFKKIICPVRGKVEE